MARPQLNTTLDQFESVVRRMREFGVASWVGSPVGDIVLGPPPATRAEKAAAKHPEAYRKQYYEELLNRRVTDDELKNLP